MEVKMKEISCEITLKRKDIFSFSMRHTYFGFSGMFGLLLSALCLVLLATNFSSFQWVVRIGLFCIGLMFPVLQPVMLWIKSGAQAKQNKNINSTLHYVIQEKGILVSQGDQEVSVPWYEVRKKKKSKHYIYVYMSPVRAFIFPADQCGEIYEEMNQVITEQIAKYRYFDPETEKATEEEIDAQTDTEGSLEEEDSLNS